MSETDPEIDPVDPPDDPETDPEEWTPPTREEHGKMVRALAARKKEAAEARRELARIKEEAGKKEPEPKGDPDLKLKRQSAITALTAEGLTREQAKSMVRLVDLDNVQLDEDGDADLDEELEDLKAKFPVLFAKGETTAPRQRAPRVDMADKGGKGGATVDQTTARLMKAAGYR